MIWGESPTGCVAPLFYSSKLSLNNFPGLVHPCGYVVIAKGSEKSTKMGGGDKSQRFRRSTSGNVYVRKSRIHGRGVFAARHIRPGEVILRIDDSRVVTDDAPLDPHKGEFQHHCDYLAQGNVVLMREPERYINHCCDPNAYVQWIGGERYVVARWDIEKDKEITYDYCIDGFGDTVWQCSCASSQCRKTIHADFFRLPIEKQREYFIFLSDWYIQENRRAFEELKGDLGL